MKFGEWSDYCLPLVKSRMKANTYHNNYEIPLYLHLQPYFGEWEPREIKTSMVQQFVDIKGERYAKETIKKMTGCMSLLRLPVWHLRKRKMVLLPVTISGIFVIM